jgi:hypothetical protein
VSTLIVPWYRSRSERHNAELLGALFANLRAPGVERVLLVSECDPPPVHDPRLEVVPCQRRPTWWELFELVRDEGPFAIVNADCAVVDARHIATLGAEQCLWISRWEVCPAPHRYLLARYGADLFGFGSVPDRIAGLAGHPGEYSADTFLGEALEAASYQVRNLPCAVPPVHFHAERDRSEEIARPGLGSECGYHSEPSGDHPSPLWSETVPPFESRVPPLQYPVI